MQSLFSQNPSPEQLCMDLLHCDKESEVIAVLREAGYWDEPGAWRPYGDAPDNFSTIGNQQSASPAALVEKVVNSIDAVLMRECILRGMDPESTQAPQSTSQAVAAFFGGDASKESTLGHIRSWDQSKRTKIAELITLSATGERRNPSFTIVDQGEGQTPDSFPDTLLSLHSENKSRIPFVQGKFNMGSTGALQFCGHDNLQLIISKRDPAISGKLPPDEEEWGFTVVRRENPESGRKLSVYTYLAPIGADADPLRGTVLRFNAMALPVMPERNKPYTRTINHGTVIKLYEYDVKGFTSHILLRPGLLQRLEVLLPEPALPIRLHECRNFRGHLGSFDTTLSGLSTRLDDDRAENLEEGFPTTAWLGIDAQRMPVTVYAFKPKRASTYRRHEGVVFLVNGQAHGNIPATFFTRTAVGMDRLSDSILVLVDCSTMNGRYREDLFMNSRDRIRDNELSKKIEDGLSDVIKNHQGLRALKERRRREEIHQIEDSGSLQQVLESVIRTSPSFATLFGFGNMMGNPFRMMETGPEMRFVGKPFPTYFNIRSNRPGTAFRRECPINTRFRITFETDAANDYFDRQVDPGLFSLSVEGHGLPPDYSLNLVNGAATLTASLPGGVKEGEKLLYVADVSDIDHPLPLSNRCEITVAAPTKPRSGGGKPGKTRTGKGSPGLGREEAARLALPRIVHVYQTDWDRHDFDKSSALKVIQEGDEGITDDPQSSPYTFYVNMDNQYLQLEMKQKKGDITRVRKHWEYGLVLIGLSFIKDRNAHEEMDKDESLGEFIGRCTRALAPVVIPLVESIASIDFNDTDDDELEIGDPEEDSTDDSVAPT